MADCCPCDFIQVGDFQGRVPMPSNVASDDIMFYVREAQIAFIKPLLCKELYEELCAQISEDDVSEANGQLLCYIRDIHVRYAFSDFLLHHPVRVTAASVVRKVADESEFVSEDYIKTIAKDWRLKAQNYVDPMYDWMKDNIDLNPLFDKGACGDCEIKSSGSGFGIINFRKYDSDKTVNGYNPV